MFVLERLVKRNVWYGLQRVLRKGLEAVKPWGFLGDMGQAVHDHAYENGYTIVEKSRTWNRLEFHEDPWVGYHTKRGTVCF